MSLESITFLSLLLSNWKKRETTVYFFKRKTSCQPRVNIDIDTRLIRDGSFTTGVFCDFWFLYNCSWISEGMVCWTSRSDKSMSQNSSANASFFSWSMIDIWKNVIWKLLLSLYLITGLSGTQWNYLSAGKGSHCSFIPLPFPPPPLPNAMIH